MDKLTKTTHQYRLNLWASRIAECKRSGMTVIAWCEQNQLSMKSYYYWMRKIKHEAFENLEVIPAGRTSPEGAIPELQIPVFGEIDFAKTAPPPSNAAVTIRLSNITVEIKDGASETVIAHALRAIEPLC